MPLKPISELLAAAQAGGYALGYFESWNLESLLGAIEAAELTRSPTIVGFNGEFLTRPERLEKERIGWYAALGRAAAESASVPCGLIFNECPDDGALEQAVRAGFNLVMLADPQASYENYRQRVARLVKFAHQHGTAVEAELGELPTGLPAGLPGEARHASTLTDPELAGRFVSATGIDLLSVSIGNVHILLDGQRQLDLDHLEKIKQHVKIPLGLHGGSGIAADSLRAAIRLGVVKVNYGTYTKQRYLAALRKALGSAKWNYDTARNYYSAMNPHKLLGMGGPEDILVIGRQAVREAILERIEWLGCCGQAK